jgi:hypothetical protein
VVHANDAGVVVAGAGDGGGAGGKALIVSGWTMNSRVRVRVPSPEGVAARSQFSVFSVCVHVERVPITPANVSADCGTTWRWAMSVVTLPRTWSASVGLSGERRSPSSCVPSRSERPAERPRPNNLTTPPGATAENSSTSTTVGTGWAWSSAAIVSRSWTIAAARIAASGGRRSASRRNRTIPSVTKEVVAPIDVYLAGHQRMEPPPQRIGIQRRLPGHSQAWIARRLGKKNPLCYCERGPREIGLETLRHVVEDLVNEGPRQAIPNAFMSREIAFLRECGEPRQGVRSMLLEQSIEGVLKVMAEGQVAEVVDQASEAQALLEQKGGRPSAVRDAGR